MDGAIVQRSVYFQPPEPFLASRGKLVAHRSKQSEDHNRKNNTTQEVQRKAQRVWSAKVNHNPCPCFQVSPTETNVFQ